MPILDKHLKRRVYTDQDFKAADRLGKIYIHLMDPDRFILSGRDDEWLSMMRRAFHIMSEESSHFAIERFLKDIYHEKHPRTILKLIQDTQKFFGSIISRNKSFDKLIQRERILAHIKVAKEAFDMRAVAALEKLLMQIDGTDKEAKDTFKWEDLQLPDMIFTDDPKALHEGIDDAELVDDDEGGEE